VGFVPLLLWGRLLGLFRGGQRGGGGPDLSPNGAIAKRIRAQLAAHRPLPDACFAVAPTVDGRGKGLFVADHESIEQGTYLFDYAGEVIDQAEYDARYPKANTDGPYADYAVGIVQDDGSSHYVDAVDALKSNLARYMNHAEAAEANCVAWTLSQPAPRVLIFANEPLAPGVELVWDYGREYWEGRDGEKI